jgi:hypothetical protein
MVIRMFSVLAAATVIGVAGIGSAGAARSGASQGAAASTSWTITIKETQTTERGGAGSFALLGGNAADADSGKVTFTQSAGKPSRTTDRLQFLAVTRTETFKGKRGTIVIRSAVREFGVDVREQDDAISTGAWSIVRGTGRYAGLTGGGGLVGIVTAVPAGSSCVGYSCYAHSYRYEGRVSGS